MNIGIFYATYSGGTQAASEFLTQSLQGSGHQVTMKMISEVAFEDTLNYDLIIFASPSWDFDGKEGQPHQDFIAFLEKSAGKKMDAKNCAVLGLGDSSYAHFCGAVEIMESFITTAGGKLKAESLKIDGYLFDMEKNNTTITEWAKKLTS
ncbi:flavodoxin domain-containing protein [Candidatus Roizmanbacteria bacterium]|nr:flavodoxin domain-containing protein [Candidatus Roizmanbacteria bacterium]